MATKTTIDKSGLSPEVLAYVEGLESQNAELAETLTKANDLLETLDADTNDDDTDDDGGDVDDLLKSADPKLAEIVKSAQAAAQAAEARAAEAEKIAKGERDIRATAEFVSKAAGLQNLGADAAKLGVALKDVIEKCGQDTHDTLWAVITGANEQIGKSGLFGEAGSSAQITKADTSSSEIIKRANALVTAGTATDFSAAVAQVVAADPSLYIEHRSNTIKGA